MDSKVRPGNSTLSTYNYNNYIHRTFLIKIILTSISEIADFKVEDQLTSRFER